MDDDSLFSFPPPTAAYINWILSNRKSTHSSVQWRRTFYFRPKVLSLYYLMELKQIGAVLAFLEVEIVVRRWDLSLSYSL